MPGPGPDAVTALTEVIEVVDRLVSPGGCPWDASQTHESLLTYLVEETYEVVDAVAARSGPGGDEDLAEELGDVLLQVVFHARLAQARGAFDVEDVARGLVAKLVRRHPHVFDASDATATDRTATDGPVDLSAADVQQRWDDLKAREKPDRGPLDGIPVHLPALARADKVLGRLERVRGAGLVDDVSALASVGVGGTVGAELFEAVRRARALGIDPEAALRDYTRLVESAARAAADHEQ